MSAREEAKEPGPAPRRLGAPLLLRAGLFAMIFFLSLAASWQIRLHFADPDEEAEADTPHSHAPAQGLADRAKALELLALGDHALESQKFAEAAARYGELARQASELAPPLDYRLGLCFEALGQVDKALASYRRACASPQPALACAATLSVARCLLRANQPADARHVVAPYLLDEARLKKLPQSFAAEARYLAALAFARQTHAAQAERTELDRTLDFSEIPLEVPLYLEETAAAHASPAGPHQEAHAKPHGNVAQQVHEGKAQEAHGQAESKPHFKMEKGPGESPVLAEGHGKEQSVYDLVETLAQAAGWRTQWSEAARQQATQRLLDLEVHHWRLPTLVAVLADLVNVTAQLDNQVLSLGARQDLGAPAIAVARWPQTLALLEDALSYDRTHPLAPAALLELGNWHAGAGGTRDAVRAYEQILREHSSSGHVLLAYFNRGQLRLRDQSFLQARRDFYRAIDQAPGHAVAVRAYLRLGQLAIEEEAPEEAADHLRRALKLAGGSPLQPTSALHLAGLRMLSGENEQVRALLAQQRARLKQTSDRATASFLDLYARYRLALAGGAARREASDLVTILWSHEGAHLGFLGHALAAQAFDELGLVEQAERALRQALASVHAKTPLAAHLELKLARALLRQSERAKAEPLLERLSTTPSAHQAAAAFELAKLELQDQRFKDCEHRCRTLWPDMPTAYRSELLQLWGQALEGMGELEQAVKCFAGAAPN